LYFPLNIMFKWLCELKTKINNLFLYVAKQVKNEKHLKFAAQHPRGDKKRLDKKPSLVSVIVCRWLLFIDWWRNLHNDAEFFTSVVMQMHIYWYSNTVIIAQLRWRWCVIKLLAIMKLIINPIFIEILIF